MGKDVIIACDFASAEETIRFLDKFNRIRDEVISCDHVSISISRPFVKIGMELFYSEGPQIIKKLKERGHRVFLDLKLHDIPNTVKKSMTVLGAYGVDMVNVHAAGGIEMMRAAKEGLMLGALPEVVRQYALNAKAAGLDGVVCSAQEAADIHMACGADFLTVTPGIRLAGDSAGDQKRVMTPADARDQGSDYIVVGRSITAETKPIDAYQICCRDFIG